MSRVTLHDDPVLRAFVDAGERASELLTAPEVAVRWGTASAVAGYTVGGLAAHVFLATQRIEQVLESRTVDESGAPLSVADFYGPNRVSNPDQLDDGLHPAIRAGAHQVAASGAADTAQRFSELLGRLTERLPSEHADRPVSAINVPERHTTLRDYLRTRVVELVVHGDDLAASTGVEFAPPPRSIGVVLEVFLDLARARSGDLAVIRAFARVERSSADALRVL